MVTTSVQSSQTISVTHGNDGTKIAYGRTQPGATNWTQNNNDTNNIILDIDTTAAGFTNTPIYITSIGGDAYHFGSTGASSIYKATPTGFRIAIRWDKDFNTDALTPAVANQHKWHINWVAIEPSSGTSTQASSTTTSSTTSTQPSSTTTSSTTGTQPSSTTTPKTPFPDPQKYYYIVAKHSGKTIAVKDASKDNEANIIQFQATSDNHKFQFQPTGDGYYYIVAKHSGKTIAVKDASKDNGSNIIQFQATSDNHKFKLENAGDGYFYIVAKHSGKTIAVKDASKDNGSNIIQFQATSDNHKWKLEVV